MCRWFLIFLQLWAISVGRTKKDKKCDAHIDMAIMMDESGSFKDEDIVEAIKMLSKLTGQFTDSARVAFVHWSSKQAIEFGFNNYSSDMKAVEAAIAATKRNQGGGTLLGNSLRFVRDNIYKPGAGERPEADDVIMIVTDGESSDDDVKIATELRDKGTLIFVLAFGDFLDQKGEQHMLKITGDKDHLLKVKDSKHLQGNLYKRLEEKICKEATAVAKNKDEKSKPKRKTPKMVAHRHGKTKHSYSRTRTVKSSRKTKLSHSTTVKSTHSKQNKSCDDMIEICQDLSPICQNNKASVSLSCSQSKSACSKLPCLSHSLPCSGRKKRQVFNFNFGSTHCGGGGCGGDLRPEVIAMVQKLCPSSCNCCDMAINGTEGANLYERLVAIMTT